MITLATLQLTLATLQLPLSALESNKSCSAVQPFHHVNIVGSVHLPPDCWKGNTSRTPGTCRPTPTTTEDQTEQHIQPVGNKKYK